MRSKVFFRHLVFAMLITACTQGLAQKNMPEITVDGMQQVSDSNFALVYALPDINLREYERIYLDDAYVAFKKQWRREQDNQETNGLSAQDMDRIKIELRYQFEEIFSRTLQESGYELAAGPADDVLQIKPAIVNLDISKTDKPQGNHVYSFSESAGEMTLYLELYDSASGDIIARVIDRKEDRRTGYFQWQDQISNRAAARRILQVWASSLKDGLDQARTTIPRASAVQAR